MGVVLAAVLASCLILPTIGQLATLDQTWMAAAILGIPTVAVLTVTGYRHYGPARSLAVAVVVMSVALMASWVFSVHVVAAAMSGSTTTLAMGGPAVRDAGPDRGAARAPGAQARASPVLVQRPFDHVHRG
ncbi:hypothetical protein M4D79_08035 [Mycolicibacterium novocastrense]|nr:hypothetical protein M4D79_08035 [Mycolicibacterium novocastrense]